MESGKRSSPQGGEEGWPALVRSVSFCLRFLGIIAEFLSPDCVVQRGLDGVSEPIMMMFETT